MFSEKASFSKLDGLKWWIVCKTKLALIQTVHANCKKFAFLTPSTWFLLKHLFSQHDFRWWWVDKDNFFLNFCNKDSVFFLLLLQANPDILSYVRSATSFYQQVGEWEGWVNIGCPVSMRTYKCTKFPQNMHLLNLTWMFCSQQVRFPHAFVDDPAPVAKRRFLFLLLNNLNQLLAMILALA